MALLAKGVSSGGHIKEVIHHQLPKYQVKNNRFKLSSFPIQGGPPHSPRFFMRSMFQNYFEIYRVTQKMLDI